MFGKEELTNKSLEECFLSFGCVEKVWQKS